MVGLKGHLVLKMLLFTFSEIIFLYNCMAQNSLKFSTEITHKSVAFTPLTKKNLSLEYGEEMQLIMLKFAFIFKLADWYFKNKTFKIEMIFL